MKKQLMILGGLIGAVVLFFWLTTLNSRTQGEIFSPHDYYEEDIDDDTDDEALELLSPSLSVEVVVSVQGEVYHPGIVRLTSDDRIADAIEMAGGLTDDADIRGLNLAMRLYDEMLIFVGHLDDGFGTSDGSQGDRVVSGNLSDSNLISINTATVPELQTLPGIGPVISNAIVDFRNQNGPFTSIEDLILVPGIGVGILGNIRDLVEL